jgi:hypothetical protein
MHSEIRIQDRSSSVKSISLLVPDEGAIVSDAIRGNQWPSEDAGHQRSSVVPEVRRMPRLEGHQRSSEVIRGHQLYRRFVACRGWRVGYPPRIRRARRSARSPRAHLPPS